MSFVNCSVGCYLPLDCDSLGHRIPSLVAPGHWGDLHEPFQVLCRLDHAGVLQGFGQPCLPLQEHSKNQRLAQAHIELPLFRLLQVFPPLAGIEQGRQNALRGGAVEDISSVCFEVAHLILWAQQEAAHGLWSGPCLRSFFFSFSFHHHRFLFLDHCCLPSPAFSTWVWPFGP